MVINKVRYKNFEDKNSKNFPIFITESNIQKHNKEITTDFHILLIIIISV